MGFSLVELLVAMGVFSVFLFTSISLFTSQQREIRGLNQRAEALELKTLLLKVFSNADNCTVQLRDKIVDVPSGSPPKKSTAVIALDHIFHGDPQNSSPVAISGQKLPLSNYGLMVQKISLKDIEPTGNPKQYQGVIEVAFDDSSLALPLRAVSFQQVFRTYMDGAVMKISACEGTSNLGQMLASSCTRRTAEKIKKDPCGITARAFCEKDEIAISGGSYGGSNMAAQDSSAIIKDGKMVGWQVRWYGTQGNCDQLNSVPDGEENTGSQPCFGKFCGGSEVLCCH